MRSQSTTSELARQNQDSELSTYIAQTVDLKFVFGPSLLICGNIMALTDNGRTRFMKTISELTTAVRLAQW